MHSTFATEKLTNQLPSNSIAMQLLQKLKTTKNLYLAIWASLKRKKYEKEKKN